MSWAIMDTGVWQVWKYTPRIFSVTLHDGRTVNTVGLSAAQLQTLGLIPVVNTWPAYDDTTHRLGSFVETVELTRVVRTYSIVEREIVEATQRTWLAVDAKTESVLVQGLEHDGHVWNTTRAGWQNLGIYTQGYVIGEASGIPGGNVIDYPTKIITRDRAVVSLSESDLKDLVDAYYTHLNDTNNRAKDLFDDVEAATTIADLEAVMADLDNGWPPPPPPSPIQP